MRLPERVFRAVLWLYPAEFRDRFGEDMTGAYRAARMDAALRGRRGVAAFWSGVAADALLRAPGEHMQMTLSDLRYALRGLARAPVFTVVAIVTLALGIGANTAIFSVVHAVALRALPYREPSRLVRIWEKNDRLQILQFSTSVPNYMSFREQSRTFDDLAGWRSGSVTLTTGGEPQRLARFEATATLLPTLGIAPVLGRNFTREEDTAGGPRVALLAESIWRSRFGANASLVGQPITLDGIPHTVVGILPDGVFVSNVDVLTPLAPDMSKESRGNHMMATIGRMKAGVTLAQAQQDMDGMAARLGQAYPESNKDWGVTMASFYDWIVPEGVRTGLYVLLASVGVVLLIACSNVANLMLARAALRQRELAVRLALGASRYRIVRQVLTESLLVSTLGGFAGVMLAWWCVPVLQTYLTRLLPRADEIRLNAPVLWFSLGVTLLTGVLFGMLPAALSSRRDTVAYLKEGGRGGSGRQQGLARRLLVIGQMTLATVLLTGAALLVQSFQRLQRVDLGFTPASVTTAMIGLPDSRYPSTATAIQFYSRLLDDLRAIPGVGAAALSSGPPFGGGNTGMSIRAIGANAHGAEDIQADWRVVSDDYFRTLAVPILRGRTFDAREIKDATELSLVLSSDLARQFWPDADPVGRQVQLGNKRILRIVGIVGNVRNLSLGIQPRPTMYFSTRQLMWSPMAVIVRSASDVAVAPTIRKAVAVIDPQLAVFSVRTMEAMLDLDAAQPRLTAWLVALFAALALLLAAIGVYGVLAYLVAQRRQEIGVRMALGAQPGAVLQLVLGHALRLAAAGVALGVVGALVLGPYLASQLFGVNPRAIGTLAGVASALIAVAVVASYLPARRATRVDPLIALRAE
jgi:putative ABC transport system permease protein